MSTPLLPTSDNLTVPQLKHCLSLYPKVIEKHYGSKIKDPKKASEAVKRDRWRYEELPLSLKDQDGHGKGTGMSLEQLQRLVEWKITHGPSRPFLPAMIRKNDPKSVPSSTSSVADLLSTLSNQPLREDKRSPLDNILTLVQKALDTVSKLSGVGPATASLILSVYAPTEVPFFEDEMFMWLCGDLGKEKLKYDKKEYVELFKRVWRLRSRIGMDMAVGAVEIEKASFVLGHWDLVEEQDREGMPEAGHGVVVAEENVKEGNEAVVEAAEDEAPKKPVKKSVKRGAPKPESVIAIDNDTGTRHSKRIKK